jgi:hypothetical protein
MGELTAMSVNGHKPKFTRGEPVPQLATMRLSVTRVVSDFSIREDDPPPARPRYQRGDRLPPQPSSGLVKKAREREFLQVSAGVKPEPEPFIKAPSKLQLMSLRGQRPR